MKNITSKQGILLRMNRSIQVEGAFGVIKEDYGFRRFLLRGKQKVMTEFLLMAIGYNINKKLHNKIQNNRHGMQLHEKDCLNCKMGRQKFWGEMFLCFVMPILC